MADFHFIKMRKHKLGEHVYNIRKECAVCWKPYLADRSHSYCCSEVCLWAYANWLSIKSYATNCGRMGAVYNEMVAEGVPLDPKVRPPEYYWSTTTKLSSDPSFLNARIAAAKHLCSFKDCGHLTSIKRSLCAGHYAQQKKGKS